MNTVLCLCFIFFFQQKTGYHVRISDLSSDVCSFDLVPPFPLPGIPSNDRTSRSSRCLPAHCGGPHRNSLRHAGGIPARFRILLSSVHVCAVDGRRPLFLVSLGAALAAP